MDIEDPERLVRVTCGMQLQLISGVPVNKIKDLVLSVDDDGEEGKIVQHLARLSKFRLHSLEVSDTQQLDGVFGACPRVKKLAMPYLYQWTPPVMITPSIITGFSRLTQLELSVDLQTLIKDNYLGQVDMPHLQSFALFGKVNRHHSAIPFDDILEMFQTIARNLPRTISALSIGWNWNDPIPMITSLLVLLYSFNCDTGTIPPPMSGSFLSRSRFYEINISDDRSCWSVG
jgi:hypothetical protein